MPKIFPEKIKVGDEEYPDLAAMALNIAVARIREKSKTNGRVSDGKSGTKPTTQNGYGCN